MSPSTSDDKARQASSRSHGKRRELGVRSASGWKRKELVRRIAKAPVRRPLGLTLHFATGPRGKRREFIAPGKACLAIERPGLLAGRAFTRRADIGDLLMAEAFEQKEADFDLGLGQAPRIELLADGRAQPLQKGPVFRPPPLGIFQCKSEVRIDRLKRFSIMNTPASAATRTPPSSATWNQPTPSRLSSTRSWRSEER